MPTIAFDLDGTLINSLEGIYSSLDYACKISKVKTPNHSLIKDNIGPPIRSFLPKLLNINTKDILLENILKDFRKHHDSEGFRSYKIYP